ncbi:MAG: 50S ribosomal protein L6 [Acidimicrobiia bacterium]|jgi:large subunit ribosomal protein L6|nr:MAG: 50S ribosomal protein L6 [Acidimicrobiia bacterium]
MSRVGKAPIALPDKVEIAVDGETVTVKGPKGELTRTFTDRVGFEVEDGVVTVTRANEQRQTRALHGLSRALLNNMVQGVHEGYRKELSIVGVGYRASMKGSQLELLVGFSHPVLIDAVEGITVEVPEPTKIIVSGIDKERVGQVAANIRAVKPPEPYKGKGIRYVDEYVRRKAGKAGVR